MRAEDLLKELTDDQLVEKANTCFVAADQRGTQEKTQWLAEADLYLRALARREDARTSKRDFKLEIAVIVLISVEIVLSLIFGFYGIHEGNKQAKALDDLNKSAAATTAAISSVHDSLESLSKAQTESLARLNQMSETLRDSFKTSSTAARAMREQLNILQQEQAERTAQLAKKPKLQLSIGQVPVIIGPFNTLRLPNYPVREQTDTSITFDLRLFNAGTAPATRLTFRITVWSSDVSVQSSEPLTQLNEPPGSPTKTTIIPIETVRPRVNIPMTLTLTFPKGHDPFDVDFTADANEIETGTPLGAVKVTPRKPAN